MIGELLGTPENTRFFADLLSGADAFYGQWMPDLELGGSRFATLMRAGRPVLLGHAEGAAPWADRVDLVHAEITPTLVRPDGYVAWKGADGLPQALRTWFGTPTR